MLHCVAIVGEEHLRHVFEHVPDLGTHPLEEYVGRVLQLIARTGVELLHLNTGADEIEDAFLDRLEEDRSRGIQRLAAWSASQEGPDRDGEALPPLTADRPPEADRPLSVETG